MLFRSSKPLQETKNKKRESEWQYDRPKLMEEHFRPEDSIRRGMICVKKQGNWGCLLKNLDKACGSKE